MYEDQNPFIARAMEYLEIAARYVLLNIIWILSIFPFAAVFFLILYYGFGITESPWVLIFIPIVLAAPATGGLYYATNQLAHGMDGGPLVYWRGVKSYILPSYIWAVVNLVVAFLLSVNIWFYGNAPWGFAPYLRIAFIILAAFWAMVQFYTFPFILEQEQPSYKTALRNSVLATFRFPLHSFGFLLLILALVLVSYLLYLVLWVVITSSLIAYLSNRFTLNILGRMLAQDNERQAQQKEE
jgi:hypothetical protein